MPNDLVIVLLCVACVCLGVALRGYYDDKAESSNPAFGSRNVTGKGPADPIRDGSKGTEPAVALFDERMDRMRLAFYLAWWAGGPHEVRVKFLDLPRFIRRRSEDKGIARFLKARDTFEPIR